MRKSKIYGIVGTTIFAVLVILLLLFVNIISLQDIHSEPVIINFGDSEDGVGLAVPTPATTPATVIPTKAASSKQKAQSDENLASQLDESPVTTVEKKKPTVVKQQTPKQLEDNRKKIQDDLLKQQAKAKAAADAAIATQQAQAADKARKMGSVFGSNHGAGSGDGQSGSGVKGNPLGKIGGTGSGTAGGTGNGIATISGRTGRAESAVYNSNDEGTVTVNVTVDKDGQVSKAYIGSPTNTTSPELREAALVAARKSKFSTGANDAIGIIIYHFKLR